MLRASPYFKPGRLKPHPFDALQMTAVWRQLEPSLAGAFGSEMNFGT